jgi:preprotein translocase subunit SecF
LALLVGMLTGVYSSIFVASPLLAFLKRTDANWKGRNIQRAVGPALRAMVMSGNIGSRRTRAAATANDRPTSSSASRTGTPPRPRKKKRR